MGGISHKKLTNSCGYLDTLKEFSEIMVDKGFLFIRGICCKNDSLAYSPSKRGKAQMDSADVRKTAKIANLMILAEKVIRQHKRFRIFADEIAINQLQYAYDVL